MAIRAQIVCEQTLGNEIVVNTWAAFSAAGVSPLTQAQADALAAEFATFYEGVSGAAAPGRGIDNQRPNEATLTRIVVREILAGNVGGNFFEYPFANAGSSAGELMPPESACVITLRTATSGRTGRGRIFAGPFTKTVTAEANGGLQWTPTLTDALFNATADLDTRISALVPTSWTLAVWSRKDDVHRPVTNAKVDSKIDTVSRRKNKIVAASATSGAI